MSKIFELIVASEKEDKHGAWERPAQEMINFRSALRVAVEALLYYNYRKYESDIECDEAVQFRAEKTLTAIEKILVGPPEC